MDLTSAVVDTALRERTRIVERRSIRLGRRSCVFARDRQTLFLRVLTVGGGARNAPGQRIRERLLGPTVLRAASQEAAVGAARLARLAIGRA